MNSEKYVCQVSFAGSHNSEREGMLTMAANFDIKIYGPSWSENCKNEQIRKAHRGFLDSEQEIATFFFTLQRLI